MFRKVADQKEKNKRTSVFEQLLYCKQSQNSNVDKQFKVLKRCARVGLYSLESKVVRKMKRKTKYATF